MTGHSIERDLKWFTLAASCLALFMAILDNLVLNVALPTIARDLDASTTDLQWMVSAYTLIFASLQITAGGLGDRLGRKRWFMIGTALFTSTSVLAAASTSTEMLIAARALQGIGAALIMPLSLSLISDAFPPHERGRALGVWTAVSVSGLALGPVVGGVLVEYASWHWVFLMNVPVGLITFAFTIFAVRESRDTSGTASTDLPGTVLITSAIGALTWGLIEAGNRGWSDPAIIGALCASGVLGVVFVWVEAHTEHPMVPLRFFRSATFVGANAVSFATAFGIVGFAFFWTLYQQNIHGFSAVRTGLSLVPLVIVMMAGAPISGMLLVRVGASRLVGIGTVVAAIGMLLFLRAGTHSTYVDILPALIVLGFGNSLVFAPLTTAVLNSVESAKSGVASAVNGAVREIGSAFGIALLGTIMNRAYQDGFNDASAVRQLRADPAQAPLRGALDLIGSGAGFAGRAVDQLGLPPDVAARLREASADAFLTGMDRALIVGSAAIFLSAAIAWLLIDNLVVAGTPPATAEEAEAIEEHLAVPLPLPD